jgi:tetratricopeptide (TPR) repeat protein
MALVQSGQLDEGIAHLNRAIELNPQSVEAYSRLGAALARKGLTDDAIHFLEAGLKIDPQFAPALGNMGLIFTDRGDFERASSCFEKGIRAAFDPALVAQLHFAYGNLLVKKHDLLRAIEEYGEAVRYKPDYSPAWEALSKIKGAGG